MSIRWQLGVIVGPTIGGIIIASYSISAGYAVDVFTFVISLIFLSRVRSIPASKEAEKPSLAGLLEGIRYAFRRQDLLGTYLVDLAAMFFAMPMALIPFWADQLGTPWALGLMYAAGTVGSVVITLTLGWGTAIALSGIWNSLILVLIFLTLAGASDMVSALFRSTMWNQTIPDNLRGRLAGIELLSYSIGPLAGQMRAAGMAAVTSLSFSVTSGGIICVIVVALLASFMPKFRKFDAKTNEFALAKLQENELRDKE
jgi:MFS family permease